MRVVIADPPAYTPPYDAALAAALVRQGVDVHVLTSRFRYGAVPPAAGYTVDDSLYRLAAVIGSKHGRLAAKTLGHPRTLARLALADCDLLRDRLGAKVVRSHRVDETERPALLARAIVGQHQD